MTTEQYVEFDAADKACSNVERIGTETASLARSSARSIGSGGAGMRGFATPSVLVSLAADLSRQTRSLGERAEDTGTVQRKVNAFRDNHARIATGQGETVTREEPH